MQDLNDKATNGELTASEWNGTRSEVQNIIENTGQALSAGDQNQLGKAIADLTGNGDFYTGSGTANAHVLTAITSNQSPTAYRDGMRVRYRPSLVNTGAVTINVAGLGAKNQYYNGAAATDALFPAGKSIEAVYHLANDRFDVVVLEDNTRIKTQGFSLKTAFYENKSFSVTSQEISPESVFFKDDGLKMYVVGISNDTVYQYSLSTAWDVSTASYDSVSFSVATQATNPVGLFFKSDGMKFYILNSTGVVYQYSLSTAWVLTGATYDSVSFSVATEDSNVTELFFKSDGAKMYVVGLTADTVYQYTLPTPWVLTAASYDTVSLSVTIEESSPQGLCFNDDGTKMFVCGPGSDFAHQYSLPTAWVLTGGIYDNISLNLIGQDSQQRQIIFGNSGKRLYMIGQTNDTVYQYVSSITYD